MSPWKRENGEDILKFLEDPFYNEDSTCHKVSSQREDKKIQDREDVPELLEDPVPLLLLLVPVNAHRLIPVGACYSFFCRTFQPVKIILRPQRFNKEFNFLGDLPMPSHIPGQLITFALGFGEHQDL